MEIPAVVNAFWVCFVINHLQPAWKLYESLIYVKKTQRISHFVAATIQYVGDLS